MKRFFALYEVLVPMLLFPAMCWVWAHEAPQPSVGLAFMASLVVFAYVVPGLGTNVTQLYEFKTRNRLGRMRMQQGFVLSSFAALVAWVGVHWGGWFVTALLCASLVTLYDAYAIQSGFIVVYNKPRAEGRGAWAIALDYAPVFFFSFGTVLGLFAAALKGESETSPRFFVPWTAALMLVPVAALELWSRLRHGHSGCWPYLPHV